MKGSLLVVVAIVFCCILSLQVSSAGLAKAQTIAKTINPVSPTNTSPTPKVSPPIPSTAAAKIPHGTNLLTYVNTTYGIKVQYPSNWIKIQGASVPNATAVKVVQFLAPRQMNSSSKSLEGLVRISVVSTPNNTTLDQLTQQVISNSMKQNASFHLNSSAPISLKNGGLGHRLVYTYKDPKAGLTSVVDVAVLKGNNAYIITFDTKPEKYLKYRPIVEQMIESFQITKQ